MANNRGDTYEWIRDGLPPIREALSQGCVFRGVGYAAEMQWGGVEIHDQPLVDQYERRTLVPLPFDNTLSRVIISLNIFRDEGLVATHNGQQLQVRISGYESHAPMRHEEVFHMMDTGTVFLGTFPLREESFDTLESDIYRMFPPRQTDERLTNHLVTFVGHGKQKGVPYLVFPNPQSPGRLGRVFFYDVYQIPDLPHFSLISVNAGPLPASHQAVPPPSPLGLPQPPSGSRGHRSQPYDHTQPQQPRGPRQGPVPSRQCQFSGRGRCNMDYTGPECLVAAAERDRPQAARPVKCRCCFRSGHRARFCEHPLEPPLGASVVSTAPARRPQAAHAPRAQGPPALPREAQLAASAECRTPAPTPLQAQGSSRSATMPKGEDISALRPAEDFVVIHAMPEMHAKAALLLTNAAYAWFEWPPARDTKAAMVRAITRSFGMLDDDVCITDHYPEPFFLRFKHPQPWAAAVGRHDFLFGEHKVQVRPWRLEDHAEPVDLLFHVSICMENVSFYAWNEVVAQQAIGRVCSLDYIELSCKTKEYMKALCVWAWTENPAMVPCFRWVTLPGRNSAPGVHERGCRGLPRRCLIHLDIVENMTGPDGVSPPMPEKHDWWWAHVGGAHSMHDGSERISTAIDDRRDRGRRSASPGASRRRSRAAPTTPDPPSSPISVFRSSQDKGQDNVPKMLLACGDVQSQQLLSLYSAAEASKSTRQALQLLASESMIAVDSPSCLPGFGASPQLTPLFITEGPLVRTPVSSRTTSPPCVDQQEQLAPLFAEAQRPLLSPPMSSPPLRPTNRRKTLAGMAVSHTVGFSLRRASTRARTRKRVALVAKKAEMAVCRGLGIIQDGEEVTEHTMKEFTAGLCGK